MATRDGRCAVVFNGEIYNYKEIRKSLESEGFVFRTEGDTEVLLELLALRGPEALQDLRGPFALAFFDGRNRSLLLARDRLGQKPLWYAPLNDRVVFASVPDALRKHPDISNELSPRGLLDYLCLGCGTGERSLRNDFFKLPPGSYLQVDSHGRSSRSSYWKPQAGPALSLPRTQAAELVRETVDRAVDYRRIADVPVGLLLSGGIDSAVVASSLTRESGRGAVKSFTAVFEDPRYDEREAARLVAESLGTEHHELLIRPNPDTMLQDILYLYDEPFADSSILPTWLICRQASQHLKVLLGGDGGDEVFCGYDRYRAMQMGQMSLGRYLLLRLSARLLRPFSGGRGERNRLRRLVRFADAQGYPPAVQYFMYRRLFGPLDLERLLEPEFAESLDLEATARGFCDLYEGPDADDEPLRAQLHDLACYLPDDLLVKADIASMMASLEVRSPFLDADVVSLGLSLPLEMRISRGRGKSILQDAFADRLPAEVFQRPKRGFGVPLAEWLRGPLEPQLREALLDPPESARRIFRTSALRGLYNDHVERKADHAHRLWALLLLIRWMQTL
jgi:asparagine synthase (glutamine-hydrolysing)